MQFYDAGFLGAGNMGGALLEAALKFTKNVAVYDTDEAKARAKDAAFLSPAELAASCHYIFIGVKPNVVADAAKSLVPTLRKDAVIVSMAAGVDLKTLEKLFGTNKVIRIMPNTSAAVGEGVILYAPGAGVSDVEEEGFLSLMTHAGSTEKLDESKINAGMAVSGCGPAYAYMFIEALADGAVHCGLPRAQAMRFAAQTLLGSAKMLLETGKHPGELKDAVCSPGGTTIEGVLALENGGFRAAVANAVIAAYDKTNKLK